LLQFSSPKQFKTELGVASFLIPKKTIQNGIRADSGLLQFSSPKQFKTEIGVASILIPKKTIQNSSFKTELGVTSFLISKSFHIY
jgi:hypothetical protein